MNTLVVSAAEILSDQAPERHAEHSFAYFGDLPLGRSWAYVWTLVKNSDDLVNESNWHTVLKTLTEAFGEEADGEGNGGEWRIEGAGHWAVGPIDQLAIRVLIDPAKGAVEGNIAPVFEKIMDLKDDVEAYPILDELDYSEREYEASLTSIKWTLQYLDAPKYITPEAVYSWLSEAGADPEDPSEDVVREAVEGIREAASKARKQRRLAGVTPKAIEAGQPA